MAAAVPIAIRSAFVLGSTSEVAQAICRPLARRGCQRFHLVARNGETNQQLVAELQQQFGAAVSTESTDLLVDAALEPARRPEVGEFDLHLITAGSLGDAELARSDAAEALRITAANYTGLLPWLTAIATPERITRPGRLWVFSSVAADRGRPSNYHYGSAKAALTVFCEGLLLRCHGKPFAVRILKAGFMATPMTVGKAPPALCASPEKDGTVIELPAFDRIELDAASGTVTAGAGVSLDQILRVIVPAGFFLPVTPGTRNVTVGGAIAADVHGKNHHVDGSFGNHVQRLLLVDGTGTLRELTPSGRGNFDEAEFFWATVGGMGLTGVIVEATFSLIPITSSLISVDTTRYRDLESLMAAMVEVDAKYRYSVAWVDSLDPKGRGVLTCGNHAPAEALPPNLQADPLHYDPKALASAPPFLPGGLLNKLTVRAFNEAWYRKAPKHRVGELQAIAPFFHPLDGVQDWNRIYGPGGFLQYQFAVPNEAAHLVPRTLEALRQVGAPSFLTVLKRFGPSKPAPLSFPIPGWTLTADVPAAVPGLLEVLDQLDEEVAAAGGRLYLSKDSRQSTIHFKQGYLRLAEWAKTFNHNINNGTCSSDLGKRLGCATAISTRNC